MLLGHDKTGLERNAAPCDLREIYDELRALERDNWITLTPDSTCRSNKEPDKSFRMSSTDLDSHRDTQTSPGGLFEMDTAAPTIPPRTSSWNLSTPTNPDTELHIPESQTLTVRKCHSPCVLVDRKCSSPSIVRKFEAMLQENEGKVLIGGVVASCSAPANSNCNTACCHNRWSYDVSKFCSSKLSTFETVQKSFSEVNITSAGKSYSDYNPVGKLQITELQIPQMAKELPVDLLLSSLEISPASPNLQGSRRNIMLEQKTAEFNRTLFQAEMGRGVEEQDSFTVTDGCSVGCQPVYSAPDEVLFPRESKFQPHCTNVTTSVTDVSPEVTLSLSISDSPIQNPEVKPRQSRCGPELQMKPEITSTFPPEQSQVGLWEATSINCESPAHTFEVKQKVRAASNPSKKTQHRAATEGLFSEHVLSANTLPGQKVEDSNSKKEYPPGAKPQPARADASLQQPQQAQPKTVTAPPSQSDSSRPGHRMMNDHPWKPLTLAAYPRREGSRSNYGAVERILKHYESAARAQQNQSERDEMTSSPDLSLKQEENVTELIMQDMHPLPFPPSPRHAVSSHINTNTPHAQLSSLNARGVKGTQLTVQVGRV